jgi:PAS domain S-box-containing protein
MGITMDKPQIDASGPDLRALLDCVEDGVLIYEIGVTPGVADPITPGVADPLTPGVANPMWRLIEANHAIGDVFGLTAEEALRINLQVLAPYGAQYDSKKIETLKTAVAQGLNQNLRWIAVDNEGVPLPVEVSIKTMALNGSRCAVVTVKRACEAQAVEDKTKKFEFIVNTSWEFMTLIDCNYTYEAVNDVYVKAHGRLTDDITGRTVEQVWGAELFYNVIKQNLDECFCGKAVNYRAWFNFHNLGRRCLDVTYYPYYGQKGRVTHAVVVRRDITKQKAAEDLLNETAIRLKKTVDGAIAAIITMTEMRDPFTAGHQRRVAKLAALVAKHMGLHDFQIEGIHVAASVHDVGKICIPSELLSKPSALTSYEFDIVKTHVLAGVDIVKGVEFPWPVTRTIAEHHERMDGSGYPYGLKGDQISIEGKILAVCEVLEAMASKKPYRSALGINRAIDEIIQNRGILYDPRVVDICQKLFLSKKLNFD